MTGRLTIGMLAGAAVLYAAAPAWAQVTFRSLDVVGITDEARAGPGPLRTATRADTTVRFYSEDGRSYVLDGYGCRFRTAPLREPLTAGDAKVAAAVEKDVADYRAALRRSIGEGAELVSVSLGELTPLGPAEGEEGERYGLKCDPGLVSAYSLDVIRRGNSRRLRILVLQTADGEAAGPSGTLAVSVMENVIFRPRAEEELSRAAPVTRDLLRALTR